MRGSVRWARMRLDAFALNVHQLIQKDACLYPVVTISKSIRQTIRYILKIKNVI